MNLSLSLKSITQKMLDAKIEFNRNNDCIDLLAVSKRHTADSIRALYQLGQRKFGESYSQEASIKQRQLADCDIEWHFIGPIQSNKTKTIAQHFDWVQSVCSEKIATRLNDARQHLNNPLNILIQVNLSNEDTKAGIHPEQLLEFCQMINALPHLKLRGLMVLPKRELDFEKQRAQFETMQRLYLSVKSAYELDTLSMGMSADYRAAIAEGSTMIRIGTELFGERDAD